MSRGIKDFPATVPERRKDTTVFVTGTTRREPTAHASGFPPASTHHDQIVPSGTSPDAILAEIRKRPYERLDLESRVAAGGMGAIEIAVDRALDRRIAVKTLHPHLHTSDSAVRMFLREARLTALLDHPHIVPLYDIGERNEHLYFAMKLIEGRTLADVIRALPSGPLDTATLYLLLDVVTKVCDALAFAHSRGVIHCDIKPANVMVGEFGQVYLMDWGIARLVLAEPSPTSRPDPAPSVRASSSATDNSVIGTPCYMSPEQARGNRGSLDARSDVFLLGAMLYELLARKPPYAASDRTETLSMAASCIFPAPRKVAGDGSVPPELERIVLRAMQREPADRYPTIALLREDLQRFMRGGGDFPRRTFAPGTAIVREGESGDAAYIVVAGHCEVVKDMPGGPEVLQVIGPGAVFGEMAILTDGARTATVIAAEETTVLVVTSAILEQEMAALKPWMATLLKSLAARFRDVDTKHRATFASMPSPARLANQVYMLVLAWGETDARGGKYMPWSKLGAELEAQMGMPPVAVFGAIARYGMDLDVELDRLTIRDPAALKARLATDLR